MVVRWRRDENCCSCQNSCQASLNDTAGGFEPSATGLSLFAVAFCALQLRTRCLYLRALFCLNMLALLHRCYMKKLWDRGIIAALLLEGPRKIIRYLDVLCFMACYLAIGLSLVV